MKLIDKLKSKSKKAKPRRGKLIVIDGSDGSGKGTQTKLLAKSLELSGYQVKVADFPQYGHKSAEPIEAYLNGAYGKDLNPYAASLFYAIDRFDASFQMKQWLDEGIIVISNRYVTSNAGHQGGKITDRFERLKFFKWLDNLEYGILDIPKPDLTIILHVPATIAQQMIDKKGKVGREYIKGGKNKDMLESDLSHLKQAVQTYQEVAKLFPKIKMINCMDGKKLFAPKTIHNKVWELVRRIALKDTPPIHDK